MARVDLISAQSTPQLFNVRGGLEIGLGPLGVFGSPVTSVGNRCMADTSLLMSVGDR